MNAYILDRAVHGEKFWRVSAISADEGVFSCLLRLSSKKTGTVVPDLFDEADLRFDRQKAGTDAPRFVREYTLRARRTGISGNYSALVFASRFAAVLAKNAVPPDARAAVFKLCGIAIDAFADKPRCDATYFKSLWVLARENGLPVREDWFNGLSFGDKALVSETLHSPLDALSVPENEVSRLISRIEFWLSRENEFSFA